MISLLSGRALSAAELGRELGISQASASYHLRKLAAAGFLDLAEERVVRGGRERRYRYDAHPQRSIEPASRHDFVFATAAEIRRRIERADHTQPASGWSGSTSTPRPPPAKARSPSAPPRFCLASTEKTSTEKTLCRRTIVVRNGWCGVRRSTGSG